MSTWEEYLANQQNVDGVQFSWNMWPHSRIDAQRLIVPVAAFYTPLKERPADHPPPPPLFYDPVVCTKSSCKAVLNPLCQVDFRTKTWSCPFCNQRNPFPANYAMIAENNLPPELAPQFTTIEYTIPKTNPMPPIFLFVVDTCLNACELKSLKESIQTALSLLPVDALVGLITFGRMVHVHELGVQGVSRSYVFKGTSEVTSKKVRDILSLNLGRPSGTGPTQYPVVSGPAGIHSQPPGGSHPTVHNKFLQAINECDMSMTDLIEQIQPDQWPIAQGHRPLRATGAALAVAVTLLEVITLNLAS